MTTKWAARKRAQRSLPSLEGQTCGNCGATVRLERHHPDYSDPDRFEVLCVTCHVAADQRNGHRRQKQPIPCKVCGRLFMPSHSKNHHTCGRECLSAIGRLNANKRWHPGLPPSLGPPAPPSPSTPGSRRVWHVVSRTAQSDSKPSATQ